MCAQALHIQCLAFNLLAAPMAAAIAAAAACPACRSQDILLFPSVQRHRYFRIKQRLPGAAAQAAKLTAAAFAGAAATALLRGGGTAGWPLSLAGTAGALLGGSLCAFCWLMGAAALEVVFTERLRPDDYSDRDVLAAMSACLGGKKGDLMQGLALHDARCAAGSKFAC
jgi:nucleoporin NDC1